MSHLLWHLQWWERLAFAEGRSNLGAKGHVHHQPEVLCQQTPFWEESLKYPIWPTKVGLPYSRGLTVRVGFPCNRLLESLLHPQSTVECDTKWVDRRKGSKIVHPSKTMVLARRFNVPAVPQGTSKNKVKVKASSELWQELTSSQEDKHWSKGAQTQGPVFLLFNSPTPSQALFLLSLSPR